jgi:glycine/D-amino acid oxidase-like deaminating enzyme/nitrite reductase/ring-hydroxylating ferredoxin subunit
MDAGPGRFAVLPGDWRADVAVVGAGITGITTAYLLKRRGKNVVLVDANFPGSGESARAAAHLTHVLDARLSTLAARLGREVATVAVHAHSAAIDWIEAAARNLGIECGFARVPGFLFCQEGDREGARTLEEEAEAAALLGLDASMVRETPLPFAVGRALRFEAQAQFHPLQYLTGLLRAVDSDGSRVFERTRVETVQEGEPCKVKTDRGTIICDDVVIAAHVPFTNRLLLHTKLAPHRSYAVAMPTTLPEVLGLFWDTATPYHYWRTARVGDQVLLMVGGADHHVGEDPGPDATFGALERHVAEQLGPQRILFRWSGQIIEPADGLPYIGRNSLSTRVFVATGFSGNGLTGGTIAAMILTDDLQGTPHPWSDVFAATRVRPVASARAIMRQNASAARHLVLDRWKTLPAGTLAEIRPGEGCVVETEVGPLAVYRHPTGQLSALSPICTHLSCLVAWNTTEKTWDCPCHGSRYAPNGEVLNGPAVHPLPRRGLVTEETEEDLVPPAPAGANA